MYSRLETFLSSVSLLHLESWEIQKFTQWKKKQEGRDFSDNGFSVTVKMIFSVKSTQISIQLSSHFESLISMLSY